ncbi:HlyD family secretion protein [Siphonobacter sp. SORGH_AS_1065]|uniref:HlyD family secretion protein n=1 Tax=Siphonobacter sp. SORGH_AS_1065 TaxID=3041795 RepID=UPI00277F723F|nr:HlyD family secretion protein [Siphonobacter sp. SORGH_AS_1065]MDQ1088543.1 membrane fusion protein (multidrug efflux system) [Siphonobacter sp. SORGH_AS_1065]
MNTSKYTRTDQLITRITAWVAGLIIIGLVAWGGFTVWDLYHFEATNDAQIDEYINPVTSRVTGYVRKLYYEDDQEVKKGDTLVVIDDDEYRIQKAEAEAALMTAKAQIGVLSSNTVTSDKNAVVNQLQIGAAKARLVKQQQDFERYEKLLATESITQQQFENVKMALDVAKSEYEALQKAYETSLSKTDDITAQKAVALAEIKRRQAVLDEINLKISYSVITAPYDGKMGKKTIQKGQLIQAGQTLAFMVDSEEGKWVVANYKETQIRHMHLGQTVDIETDAFPGEVFHGEIVSLSAATGSRFSLLPPDNATGNFVKIIQRVPVRIKLTDDVKKTQVLRAGMNAVVTIKKGV